MEIVAAFFKVKMSIQNVPCHIVRIARGKSYSVESWYFIECFEEFSERSSHTWRFPDKLLWIPEIFSSLFAIAVYILSEECDFFRSLFDSIFHFFYDFSEGARDFFSSGIGHDTKSTIVITSCLDDDIGTAISVSFLFDSEIGLKGIILTNIFSIDD